MRNIFLVLAILFCVACEEEQPEPFTTQRFIKFKFFAIFALLNIRNAERGHPFILQLVDRKCVHEKIGVSGIVGVIVMVVIGIRNILYVIVLLGNDARNFP